MALFNNRQPSFWSKLFNENKGAPQQPQGMPSKKANVYQLLMKQFNKSKPPFPEKQNPLSPWSQINAQPQSNVMNIGPQPEDYGQIDLETQFLMPAPQARGIDKSKEE